MEINLIIDIVNLLWDLSEIAIENEYHDKIKRYIFPCWNNLKIGYDNFRDDSFENSELDKCIINRSEFEKSNVYRKEKFEKIIEEICILNKSFYRKTKFVGAVPIPFSASLGYIQQYSKNLSFGENFVKLKSKNFFGKSSAILNKNDRKKSTIKIEIAESFITNDDYDFSITRKNCSSKFSKKSFTKKMNEIFNEISKWNRNIEEINLTITASPAVSFLVGQIISNKKYLFTINHYFENERKLKKTIALQNTTILFL